METILPYSGPTLIDERAYRILEAIQRMESARFRDLLSHITNPRTLSHKLTYLLENSLIRLNNEKYELTSKGLEVYEALARARRALLREHATAMNIERIPHAFLAPVLAHYVDILCGRFEEKLLGLLVFGSLARGTWKKDSDVDLLIVLEGWRGPLWSRLGELWPLRSRLRQTPEYKRAVQQGHIPIIQHYPLSDQEAKHFHRIYLDAAVEGIILYEKENFLSQLMEIVKLRLQEAGAKRITIPGKGHYWLLEKEHHLERL